MSIPTILKQVWWSCAWVSMLGALKLMRPEIDEQSLLKELTQDKSYNTSYMNAVKFFQKKWLIKWIKPVIYSPFVLKKQPIITWFSWVDWNETNKPPYKVKFHPADYKWYLGSHYTYIVSPWKMVNSWWKEWWDNGCFYFESKDLRKLKQCFILIL